MTYILPDISKYTNTPSGNPQPPPPLLVNSSFVCLLLPRHTAIYKNSKLKIITGGLFYHI